MAIKLKVPQIGESITEVEIGAWLKNKGDRIRKDEAVVSLESEKATVELPSPESGTLSQILKQKGEVARVGEVIGILEKDGEGESAPQKLEKKPVEKVAPPKLEQTGETKKAEARVMPAAQRA